jgi:hypothetical protein
MKPILYASRDEAGAINGWLRVANGSRHLSIQESVIQQGVDAIGTPGVPEARRAEIAQWVQRANDHWPLPKGDYPLVGRAAIVIENDTTEARSRFRVEGEYRAAVNKRTRTRTTSAPARRPASASDAKTRADKAVLAARKALTAIPRPKRT